MHKTIKPWHLLGALDNEKHLMRHALVRMSRLGDVGVISINNYRDILVKSAVVIYEICGSILTIHPGDQIDLITRCLSLDKAFEEFGGVKVMEILFEGTISKDREGLYERAN